MNFKLNINVCYVTAKSLQAFAITFVVVVVFFLLGVYYVLRLIPFHLLIKLSYIINTVKVFCSLLIC